MKEPCSQTTHPAGVRIPFGLKDQQLFFIDEVSNGLSCGCVCPNCGNRLEARNRGKIKAHHFAHAVTTDCNGGYETAIHLMAKQLLLEAKELTTPEFHQQIVLHAVDGNRFTDEVRIPSTLLRFASAEAEVTIDHLRPDLALSLSKGQTLLVEIRVTHAVTEDKATWAAETNRAMLEIDLSDLTDEDLLDKAHFGQRLIGGTTNKQWIHNPKGVKRVAEKRCQLEQDVEQYNITARIAIQRRAERDAKQHKEREERKASVEQRKQAERAKIQLELEWLCNYSQEQSRSRSRARPSGPVISIADLLRKDQLHDKLQLTDIDVKWDDIFLCSRQIWQQFALDCIYGHAGQLLQSINELKRKIVQRFGILSQVAVLNNLKQQQKSQGKQRDQWYQDKGCWFLTNEENRSIPTPFLPVKRFIQVLSDYGVVGIKNEDLIVPLFGNHEAFINDFIEDLESRSSAHKQQKEHQKLQDQVQLQKQQNLNNERRLLCVASELRVLREFGGQGVQCKKCNLTSPRTDHGKLQCPFCGGDQLIECVLNEYLIENSRFRYRFISPARAAQNKSTLSNLTLISSYEVSARDLLD